LKKLMVCPICYEPMRNGASRRVDPFAERITTTECEHKFHAACLARWYQASPRRQCPLCRRGGFGDGTRVFSRTELPAVDEMGHLEYGQPGTVVGIDQYGSGQGGIIVKFDSHQHFTCLSPSQLATRKSQLSCLPGGFTFGGLVYNLCPRRAVPFGAAGIVQGAGNEDGKLVVRFQDKVLQGRPHVFTTATKLSLPGGFKVGQTVYLLHKPWLGRATIAGVSRNHANLLTVRSAEKGGNWVRLAWPHDLSTRRPQTRQCKDAPECGSCGIKEGPTTKLWRCARCMGSRYCSKPCQRSHWPHHKPICTPPTLSPGSARATSGACSESAMVF